ncbi:uncharacterized protein F4812DRAFT_444049 [Daldinia caldariorum]|uniref:uncharacterized protein n=1 Tax=Daldinia caldariorum TaxID=326644 RepID=UPI0020089924|nr:uncharacterized protein F4812DRAFT_444049 [Daldinia caldariorum]KAI1464278.1 hypothetical protein F4812DRAFT_444049 [Daldinia caldariorum]
MLTASSSNVNPAPTEISGGEAQPAASDSNAGGLGSNSETANTQASSFTFPPGVVPYGGFRTPSMTTLASMIAWIEPDGEKGSTILRQEFIVNGNGEKSNTMEREVAKQPTTPDTGTSTSMDPRWQRIRPLWIW